MEKDMVKKILLEFEEGGLPELIQRELEIPAEILEGKISKAVIITGPRRAGKTYALYQIASSLKGKNMLYFDFEDERVVKPSVSDLTLILDSYLELHPDAGIGGLYVFLDEIENVDGWEKFVRRILDHGARVVITGSNSKLLAGEIATSLRGRSVSITVQPFSFREFLIARGVAEPRDRILYGKARYGALRLLEEYAKWGGFPEVALVDDEKLKMQILQEYLITMMYRDVVERYKVANLPALEHFIKYIVTNISKPLSFNSISEWMKASGVDVARGTLIEYAKYLQNAFSFYFVGRFDYSLKAQARSRKKVYAADVGMHTANAFKFSEDRGRIMENIVFMHLNGPGRTLYYDANGYECDFVIVERGAVSGVVQVCWKLDKDSKEREVKGLVSAMKKFKLKQGTLVSWDHSGEEKVDGMTIRFVPLLEFLLG